MKILIIGATGLIGKAVTNQLKKDAYDIRIMTRNIEKARSIFGSEEDIVQADVHSIKSLEAAFKDCHRIYVNLPEKEVPEGMKNIISASKSTGIKHIGYTSGCTVRKENAWHPMIKSHYEGETLIVNSGIDYTIFRLTMVMDMIPLYANNGKAFIIGNQPHEWSWIYSGDLAKMVSNAFKNNEAKNKKLSIFGPDKKTIAEAVDIYNDKFFPQAKKAKSLPFWMASIIGIFAGKGMRYAITLFKYFANHPEEGDAEEAYKLLGSAKTGISDFLQLSN